MLFQIQISIKKAFEINKSYLHVCVVSPAGSKVSTVEFRWLEPLWDNENLFETAVVRAKEGRRVTISAIQGGIMVGYLFGALYYKRMLCVLIRIASSRRF